jgi:hypothetical protein
MIPDITRISPGHRPEYFRIKKNTKHFYRRRIFSHDFRRSQRTVLLKLNQHTILLILSSKHCLIFLKKISFPRLFRKITLQLCVIHETFAITTGLVVIGTSYVIS